MTDREKLEAVAKAFRELQELEKQRRATVALMIRSCLDTILRDPAEGMTHLSWFEQTKIRRQRKADRAAAIKGLRELATMLDNPTTI